MFVRPCFLDGRLIATIIRIFVFSEGMYEVIISKQDEASLFVFIINSRQEGGGGGAVGKTAKRQCS